MQEGISLAEAVLLQHVSIAVFTMGGAGARAVTADGKRVAAPACGVQVVDSVGAGDYFCGAFLAAYRAGAVLQTCLAAGCAAGSEVVQCQGAKLPAAAWDRLGTVYGDLLQLRRPVGV